MKPDLDERIQTPHQLHAEIENEVGRMIGIHLTQAEGEVAARSVKRKFWAEHDVRLRDYEAERRVKRRMGEGEQVSEPDLAGDAPEIFV
jgi:hypothetical protein